MKKLFMLAVLFGFSAALVGCGGSSSSAPAPKGATTPATTETKPTKM
jgi:hypothetical protein